MPRLPLAPALSLAAVAGILILGACGLGGSTPRVVPHFPPDLHNQTNWNIGLNGRSKVPLAVDNLAAALSFQGHAVTGTLHAFGPKGQTPACLTGAQDLPATGTYSDNGMLDLSFTIGGGTGILHLQLSTYPSPGQPAGPPLGSGSLLLTGGACAQGRAGAYALQNPPVSGKYSGSLSSASKAPTVQVTARLHQGTVSDAHGAFPLEGAITLSGPLCSAAFSFTDGTVMGEHIQVLHQREPLTPAAEFHATVAQNGALSTVFLSVPSIPACTNLNGYLTLHDAAP